MLIYDYYYKSYSSREAGLTPLNTEITSPILNPRVISVIRATSVRVIRAIRPVSVEANMIIRVIRSTSVMLIEISAL